MSVILDYQQPGTSRPPTRFWDITRRVYCFLLGVAFPVFCFIAAFDMKGDPLETDWQSGNFAGTGSLLFSSQNCWPMFPVLLWAVLAMGTACIAYSWSARQWYVRTGVYGGAATAIVFGLLFAFNMLSSHTDTDLGGSMTKAITAGIIAIVAGAAIIGVLIFLEKITRHRFPRSLWITLQVIVLLAIIPMVYPGIIVLLLLAPAVTFTVFGWMAAALWRDAPARASMPVIIGSSAGWMAGHMVGWTWAVQNAIIAYGKLPGEEPRHGCYICTAAQKGHARLVRSESIGGMRANDQLRWLKGGELAMKALLPKTHWLCRATYDRLGPWLARRIDDPWLADAAYLVLKPAEWAARAVLAILGATKVARGLYRPRTMR